MSAVSDILKLLDQIPIWKRVRGLPAEVDALDKRIAQLEAKSRPAIIRGRDCPKCAAAMDLVSESDDSLLYAAGVKLHHLKCPACGQESRRKFQPSKGYL